MSVVGFPGQEYRSGLPFPSPGDSSDSGAKPMSLTSPALEGRFFTTSASWEAQVCICTTIYMYTYIKLIYLSNRYLLCARHCARQWIQILESTVEMVHTPLGAYSLMEEIDNNQANNVCD